MLLYILIWTKYIPSIECIHQLSKSHCIRSDNVLYQVLFHNNLNYLSFFKITSEWLSPMSENILPRYIMQKRADVSNSVLVQVAPEPCSTPQCAPPSLGPKMRSHPEVSSQASQPLDLLGSPWRK